jgi:hypothetical protein
MAPTIARVGEGCLRKLLHYLFIERVDCAGMRRCTAALNTAVKDRRLIRNAAALAGDRDGALPVLDSILGNRQVLWVLLEAGK